MNKVKTNLKKISFAIAACVALFCTSCESTKQVVTLYTPLDYTADDAISTEIKRIEKLSETETVKALWRAKLLVDNTDSKISSHQNTVEELARMEAIVSASYKKALEEKNYFDAYRFYMSLSSCGYEKLSSLEKNNDELISLIQQNVPGLKTEKKSSDEKVKVSSLIKGTVTVYVDKGLKFEKGMGYADGVIGSGFFISKDGYIVTNNHVIADCVDPKNEGFTRLYIRLAEDPDTKIPAKVVGYDSVLDLALIKAEVNAPYVFELGSSSALDVGDKVYAIGSPLGLDRTLTSGIISAKDRKLFTVGNAFQIDAAVNSGNSGGPLIDEQGRVQAIVFAGVQNYQGLNFAIPVEYLKYELPVLYKGGKRVHPWTSSYGRTKKLPGSGTKDEGLEVQYVMPGGSAALGGLKEDDVIYLFEDKTIESIDDLQNEFIKLLPETIATIKAKDKDGNEKSCLVYLDKRPEQPGYEIYTHDVVSNSFVPIVGMKMVSISTVNKKKYSVVNVLKGSVADDMGFSENDPVDILKVQFDEKKTSAYVEIYAKKRKNGYIDVSLGFNVSMDSPYYF